jgi:hypothetical protein
MPLYARTEKRLKRKEREDELGITAIKDAMKENGELEEGSDSDNSDSGEDEDDGGISGESSDEDNDVDEDEDEDDEDEEDDEEEGEEGAGDESASEAGSDCKLSFVTTQDLGLTSSIPSFNR